MYSSKTGARNTDANRVLLHIRKNWEGQTDKTKGHLISIHSNILKFSLEGHEGESWERYTDETLLMMRHALRVLTLLSAIKGDTE